MMQSKANDKIEMIENWSNWENRTTLEKERKWREPEQENRYGQNKEDKRIMMSFFEFMQFAFNLKMTPSRKGEEEVFPLISI